jgi:zinc protease
MKKSKFLFIQALMLLGIFAASCVNQSDKQASLSVDFTKYELDNGLEVILHQDHSDPIVSLAILYHVGSNRKKQAEQVLPTCLSICCFNNQKMSAKTSFSKSFRMPEAL